MEIKYAFASAAYELRAVAQQLIEFLSLISIWNWRIYSQNVDGRSFNRLTFFGRRKTMDNVMVLLGTEQNPAHNVENQASKPGGRVVVSEFPLKSSIRVPNYLNQILRIDRSLEALLERMGEDKLTLYKKRRADYRVELVTSDSELTQIDATMLRPFANFRYGENAFHLPFKKLKKFARRKGAVTTVFSNERGAVSCSVGCAIRRRGKRYWKALRSGYPEGIFSSSKIFSEVNFMTYCLELEWASQRGYDFYDVDLSVAHPENKVLQWKRRLRGELDLAGNYSCFYLRPPDVGVSAFFWDTPVFGLEHGKVVLHLGLPTGKSDIDFAKRFREMGFGGLAKVYLHCETTPSEQAIASLMNLYRHFPVQPILDIKRH